jgi:hypothetical protein
MYERKHVAFVFLSLAYLISLSLSIYIYRQIYICIHPMYITSYWFYFSRELWLIHTMRKMVHFTNEFCRGRVVGDTLPRLKAISEENWPQETEGSTRSSIITYILCTEEGKKFNKRIYSTEGEVGTQETWTSCTASPKHFHLFQGSHGSLVTKQWSTFLPSRPSDILFCETNSSLFRSASELSRDYFDISLLTGVCFKQSVSNDKNPSAWQ